MADEKRLERIEKKLDDSNEHLASIDITLALQQRSLDYHIKRTNELQKIVLKINTQVLIMNGIFKLLTAGGLVGALILKLVGKI